LPWSREFASIIEVPGIRTDDDARHVSSTLGLAAGYDSNPGRAPDAASDSDGVLAASGGVAFAGGNSIFRCRASAEGRVGRYFDRDVFDFEELVLRGTATLATQRVRLRLGVLHALLSEPVDVDELQFPLLERSKTFFVPEAAFAAGNAVFRLGHRVTISDYDATAFDYLDHRDASTSLDLSWGRAGASRYFLRFETGGVEFDAFDPAHPRVDFDRDRFYAGLRTRAARRQSLELGLGYFAVGGAGVDDDAGLYVTARATRLFGEGSSALEAAYVRDAGASASAEFKTSSRVVLRYTRKANVLWSWAAGYRAQLADLVGPDQPAEDTLAFHAIEFGVGRALGSPGRWRGRMHTGVRLEFADRFDRAVVTVGASLTR
jgi:hypothetical protein